MRLPKQLFPNFRVVINERIVENNRRSLQEDRLQANDKKEYCCRECRRVCQMEEIDEDEEPILLFNAPPPPPLPPNLTDDTSNYSEGVTFWDLGKVMLKPVGTRSLPEKRTVPTELLHILRKRYSAMHSPSPRVSRRLYYSSSESDDLSDQDYKSFCS